MIAMKFGGTSMGSKESIANVAKIIIAEKRKPIVVVSAMSGVTDELLKATILAMKKGGLHKMKIIIKNLIEKHLKATKFLIKKNKKLLENTNNYIEKELNDLQTFLEALAIIAEMSNISHDRIVSVGEKLSAKILAAHLEDLGYKGAFVNLEKVEITDHKKPDKKFFSSLEKKIKKMVHNHLEKGEIPICTGFFGKIPGGIIQAVGRGYSDYCASILGAVFHVNRIEIWTDVDGIMSADPRIVKKAFVLEEVSFNEATEMSTFGAKVLHPKTVYPAVKKEISVWIKNTFNPTFRGTVVSKDGKISKKICKAITSKKGMMIVSLFSFDMAGEYGFIAKAGDILRNFKISSDLGAYSGTSISFVIDKKEKGLKSAIAEFKKYWKVKIDDNQAVISAVGKEMGINIGSGSKILASIAALGFNANLVSRNASRQNISFVVNEDKTEEVVKKLHQDILEK